MEGATLKFSGYEGDVNVGEAKVHVLPFVLHAVTPS
jgi:hypothetical protein